MLARCENPNTPSYQAYGEKGVRVCDRWHTFANFLEDMGDRPGRQYSLDRYPNGAGNYEPGNCRWATAKEQVRNRACTVKIAFRGEELSAAEWAERTGIGIRAIRKRYKAGWSAEAILTTSVGARTSGERNASAKLTDDDVLAIRKAWRDGERSPTRLALLYSVQPGTISFIVQGKSWRHLAD